MPRDQYEIFVSFAREGPLVDVFKAMPDVHVLFHQRIQGAKHEKFNMVKRLGNLAAVFLNTGRVLPLVEIIQKHHIDLVHTNSLVSLEGAFAAKLAGVPHIWHIRELFQEDTPRFHLILGKSFTRTLVNHLSSRVLCVSDYVCQQFEPYRSHCPEKYTVVHNAIYCSSVPPVQPRPQREALQLVYAGRVSDGKRFQDIINAFCLLKERWGEKLPYKLRVYGNFISPDFEKEILKKVDAHRLHSDISFEGYRQNLSKCLQDADLLLMPSSCEAFGRILLEAMVYGVPVVTARSGGPLEVVDEGVTGFFHQPESHESLADCLDAIYVNRQQLEPMRQYCQEKVRKHFDLNTQIQSIDMIYQDTLRSLSYGHAKPQPCWHGS